MMRHFRDADLAAYACRRIAAGVDGIKISAAI